MKKFLALIMACLMACSLVACGNKTSGSAQAQQESAEQETATPAKVKVGISMPTKDHPRWNQDGDNMKKQLEAAGYEVDLQYAGNDVAQQVNQVENMISNGDQVLVIASIDGSSMGQPLASAKEKGIPVIAYDKLLMNSDGVTYYVAFDNYLVGQKQGEYIRDVLDLDNADGPFNMEIFTGDPEDYNCVFFYDGAIDVLKPYMDAGKIDVPSGQIEKNAVSTIGWDTETAQNRMENIISSFYANGEKLDVVLCSNDSVALGVENALATNYNAEYPVITGQNCDVANIKNIVNGKQSMSIFKDTRDLANQVVRMVRAILEGGDLELNDRSTYNNGAKVVPSYLCSPVVVTIDNYKELLIDSGYYTESQIK